jgi:hypothetical protein
VPVNRHAQDQFFGATTDDEGNVKPLDEEKLIHNLFEKIPKLCSTDATIMATMHYDTYYGIYDHLRHEEERPMGLMGMHPAEDVFFTHPLFECARNYRRGRIEELFKLSFTDYIALTHPMIEMLTELANEFNREQVSVAENIDHQLQQEAARNRGNGGIAKP